VIDLSTLDARRALGAKYATKHLLDPALVCAVAEQESGWNPWAIRFEPAFERRYIHPTLPEAPTTLELTKAMSFGLMQIMGEVAIELGFAGRFLSELCDPDVGLDYGCKKLRQCFDKHSFDVEALLAYNGGGDLTYPDLVLARLPHYY
jgi:soluble lytic murein transglycosylase-like protein